MIKTLSEMRKFESDVDEINIYQMMIEQDGNLLREYEDALNKAIEMKDLHSLQLFYKKRIDSISGRLKENEQKVFLLKEALKQKIEFERKLQCKI